MAELKSTGALKLDSISDEVVLYEEDLLITMTQQEGYMTEGDNEVTVVLDTQPYSGTFRGRNGKRINQQNPDNA